MYSSPELAVQKQQEFVIREQHGCGACATRGREVLGRYLCRIDQEPGKRGFCRQWRLDQTWGKDAI